MRPFPFSKYRVPAGTDPYFANVSALLHFDGADGSTTFTDQKALTWTGVGNAQIDTAQTKFGTGALLLDGAGDYIGTPDTGVFGFGTGDFTVEMWVRRGAADGNDCQLVDFRAGGGQNGLFYLTPGSRLLAFYNGAVYGNAGAAPAQDTWAHIAFTRSSGTLRGFLNGTQQWSASMSANFGSSRPARIGANFVASTGYAGSVDDVRITKGVARYTSNFAPPTAAFPDA